jgi:ADP-ribose pyrophosphatase
MDDPPGDCLEEYFALMKERPELFANPQGEIYRILLDPADIRRAQTDAHRLREAKGMPCGDLRVGVLAHDPYLTVMREAVRFPDGTYGLYNRLLVTMGVAMLPVIDGKIVLMHRFRHGTRAWHLEVPRGCVDGGGDFEADARRELAEEIGAEGMELTHLGMLHSSTGCLDETYHLYLARIVATGKPEAHEAITELRAVPVAEVESLIASGELTDGPTLACFLRARLRGLL